MLNEFTSACLQGFATSAGLIMAIGAQNTFVLSQGLARRHQWPIAALCSAIDASLIVVGVLGAGTLFARYPLLLEWITLAGVLFLLAYGGRALLNACRGSALTLSQRQHMSLSTALLTTLALSLLNPHVYLDTMVLLGSIGGRYQGEPQLGFILGAICASLCWFFSLSLAARWLSPWFARPSAWRLLDLTVCVLMWSIALLLWQGIPSPPPWA